MENQVNYNSETKELEIVFANYGCDGSTRSDLFDFLGEFDIVLATELYPDAIVMSGSVYMFTDHQEAELSLDGSTILSFVSSLEDFIEEGNEEHLNFYNWYNNI